jgi:membrane-bound inhibitor of C-type lysozyme
VEAGDLRYHLHMKKPSSVVIAALVLCGSALAVDIALRLVLKLPAPAKETVAEEAGSRMLPGSDRDTHGCIGSAGYQWCAPKSRCLRVWEEPCSVTVMFRCTGMKTIKADLESAPVEQAKLILSDGRRLVLPRAVSGSGAHYSSADESQVFWNKGDSAWLTEKGIETYGGCKTL